MKIEKEHLSIGEVLALLQDEFPDVTISKIRFLESQGLIDPERTPSGYRKFFASDIDRLRWILGEQRDNFLPLKVIKERLDSGEADVGADDPVVYEPSDHGHLPFPDQLRERAETVTEGEDRPGATHRDSQRGSGNEHDAILGAARRAAENARAARSRTQSDTEAPQGDVSAEATDPTEAVAAVPPLEVPDSDLSSVSLSSEELLRASTLNAAQLADLERYGLIRARSIGSESYYDGQALIVARLARAFMDNGVEPRHLRMYKVAADREAGVLEQLVVPLLRHRSGTSRAQARERLAELSQLGQAMHAAQLRAALSEHGEIL